VNPGEIYDPLDEAPAPIPIVEYQESCVSKGFQVLFYIRETMWAGMALAKAPTNAFDIVTVAAVVIDPNMSRNILIIINQAVYILDLEQNELLLCTK
jgi:hypothetical protein